MFKFTSGSYSTLSPSQVTLILSAKVAAVQCHKL